MQTWKKRHNSRFEPWPPRGGIDLSHLDHKWLIRRVVESYLVFLEEDKVEEQTKEVVVPKQESKQGFDLKETSDGGKDRVICKVRIETLIYALFGCLEIARKEEKVTIVCSFTFAFVFSVV
ncbi:hypothetical protein LOK49_LG03G01700 [Camellia lanceoleosa]|uniref:Uncharacterized protein n=1 Tax=Camellia lanceoleosa TaxID=1840588 RepID=A0ACC0IBL2_9ERIC|nr:hypothetical protein LOK49_LG03G01700 [Camellia lanceoleosa]